MFVVGCRGTFLSSDPNPDIVANTKDNVNESVSVVPAIIHQGHMRILTTQGPEVKIPHAADIQPELRQISLVPTNGGKRGPSPCE